MAFNICIYSAADYNNGSIPIEEEDTTVKTGYNDTPIRLHFHCYSELSLIPRILFIAIT